MDSIVLERQTQVDAVLSFTKDKHWFLGPQLGLERCTITLHQTPRWIHWRGGHLRNCKIEAKRRMVAMQDWINMQIADCTFLGTYSGNDFGRLEDEDALEIGSIESCDFSNATLDGCRFFNTTIESIHFPHLDHVVVPSPSLTELPANKLAGFEELEFHLQSIRRQDPSVSALVYHVPSSAKRLKVEESTLNEFLQLVAGINQ